MGQWCRMDDAIAVRETLQIGKITQRHRHQITMSQGRTLRPSCGAAGIEQPGRIVCIDTLEWNFRLCQQAAIVSGVDTDDSIQALNRIAQWADRRL